MSSLQLLFTSSFDGLRYFEQNEAYAVTMDNHCVNQAVSRKRPVVIHRGKFI